MDNMEMMKKEFKKDFEALPKELKEPFHFLLDNISAIDEISKHDIPEDKITMYIESARENKDYLMLFILMYKNIRDYG